MSDSIDDLELVHYLVVEFPGSATRLSPARWRRLPRPTSWSVVTHPTST